MRILIVEDEVLIADYLEGLLEQMGYQIVGKAIKPDHALELFGKEQPDLVLMDVHLHGKTDGVDTIRQMLEIRNFPFIYLTGQADHFTVERAKATRPSAYLLKPFDERNLLISIELAIENFTKKQASFPSNVLEKESDNSMPPANSILKSGSSIFVKQATRFVKFTLDSLLYLEADRNYTELVTREHRFVLRHSLTQVLDKLADPKMVRVHRSFAVFVPNVESFTDSDILVMGKTIPLGAGFREAFLLGFQNL